MAGQHPKRCKTFLIKREMQSRVTVTAPIDNDDKCWRLGRDWSPRTSLLGALNSAVSALSSNPSSGCAPRRVNGESWNRSLFADTAECAAARRRGPEVAPQAQGCWWVRAKHFQRRSSLAGTASRVLTSLRLPRGDHQSRRLAGQGRVSQTWCLM